MTYRGEPLSFEERLANYTSHPAAKRNQRPDGLSPRQYKRLIKKDRHAWVKSTEG
jgi:hypothetical protein